MAKTPLCDWPKGSMHLPCRHLWREYFKDLKECWWAFCIAALEKEEIKQLSTLPGVSEDPSVVALLKAEEQQVLAATIAVYW